MNKRSSTFISFFLPIVCALFTDYIIEFGFGSRHTNLNIHGVTYLLIVIFLAVASNIKTVLNRILIYFWFYFYLCGLLYLNSAELADPKFSHISNESADNFYFINLIVLAVSLCFAEKLFWKRKQSISIERNDKIKSPILIALMSYPIAFFLSVFLTLGFIPMFLGESIVEDMYNYDYGAIYGAKFYTIISILAAIFYSFKSKRFFYLSLAILFALISLMDGKRAVLLVSILSSLTLYFLYAEKFLKVRKGLIVFTLGVTVIIYVGLATLRSGRDSEIDGITSLIRKFPVGVEYTDYVYSFEKFKPGNIQGYSFLRSTFGAFMNSTVLQIFGLDKQELVESGSAYAWMREYNSELGIRTGIISELYFDYGYYTFFIVFLMGFFFDYVNRKIMSSKSVINFLLLLAVYGFNTLLIVGQATVYFGSLTLVIYLYIVNGIFNYRTKRSRHVLVPSQENSTA